MDILPGIGLKNVNNRLALKNAEHIITSSYIYTSLKENTIKNMYLKNPV